MTLKERRKLAAAFRRAAEYSDMGIQAGGPGYCCIALNVGLLHEAEVIYREGHNLFNSLYRQEKHWPIWWDWDDREARPLALLLAAEYVMTDAVFSKDS